MRFFTIMFTLLLAYIVAALLFWGFSLAKQSKEIYAQDRTLLEVQVDSTTRPTEYHQRVAGLQDRLRGRTSQYLGEGFTFLLIILIGALVVFTSIRRNIRLSKQQHNFMLAVTHELKSPIAGIKLNLQTIEKRVLTEEQRLPLIKRSIREADRLNDLCNNMLIASQMEGRQYIPAYEVISLSELANESVTMYKSRYPGRFTADVEDDRDVSGDFTLLQMAINNLLENAIKYTPADAPITVSLHQQKSSIRLRIADGGKGIPDSEKKKIFTKFYRIGDEATRHTKGTGLGLYLTSKIVRQHKGKLSVLDNNPSGAVFEICLPAS